MRRVSGLALVALLAAGCVPSPVSDFPSEDTVAAAVARGRDANTEQLDHAHTARRAAAIRALGVLAAEARREGQPTTADGIAEALVRHFPRERAEGLRSLLIEVALPETGSTTPGTVAFLRGQMAESTHLAEAMHAAAALRIPDARAALTPFLEHPRHAMRVEAAMALLTLGDPGASAAVAALVRDMTGSDWPGQVRGLPLPAVRASLEARLEVMRESRQATPQSAAPSVPQSSSRPEGGFSGPAPKAEVTR